MAGHSQIIKYFITGNPSATYFGLVRNLGIVRLEIFREIHHRSFHQLHVAASGNRNPQRQRVIRLHFARSKGSTDIEFAHRSGEISRPWRRQRIYLQGQRRSHNGFLHLDHGTPPVEKRINRVDITILLHHNPLELDGRNRHLSATLGKEHILPPYHRTVPAPIVLFHFQALLLGQLYFLCMKTLQIRHATGQLRQVDQRVDLISQHYRLLFIQALLVGRNRNEKVFSGNLSPGILHLHPFVLSAPLLARLCPPATAGDNLYVHGIGTVLLSVHSSRSGRNGISTGLQCT